MDHVGADASSAQAERSSAAVFVVIPSEALFAESRDLGESRDATERCLRWRNKSRV